MSTITTSEALSRFIQNKTFEVEVEVGAVAEATGAKKVVEKIAEKTGRDCGCAKRKDWLNRAVPFKPEP